MTTVTASLERVTEPKILAEGWHDFHFDRIVAIDKVGAEGTFTLPITAIRDCDGLRHSTVYHFSDINAMTASSQVNFMRDVIRDAIAEFVKSAPEPQSLGSHPNTEP